jgi:predicted Zn-dependent protease with MMP-like domain
MSDLRKAAEMALEALDCLPWQASPIAREATQALRQALAHQALDDLAAESQRLGLYEATPEWDAVDRFHENKLKEKNT